MELKLEQVIIRDEELVVFFPFDAVVEGELVVAPIHAFKSFEEVPDVLVEKMFHVANKMSGSLFDLLGCHGTNLLIQNGSLSGQIVDSSFIRIIPRFDGDSLNLKWDARQASSDDLEGVVQAFKGFDEQKDKDAVLEKIKEDAKSVSKVEHIESDKENYLLKSLRRNP